MRLGDDAEEIGAGEHSKQDPEGRERVIALLREFEEGQASAPEPMRGFDFGFLWRELGLDKFMPGTK